MPHASTEDQLVEQPAIGWFAELGWQVAGPPPNAGASGEPADAGLLGRETKGEVVLVGRWHVARIKLNPSLPDEAIAADLIYFDHRSPDGSQASAESIFMNSAPNP